MTQIQRDDAIRLSRRTALLSLAALLGACARTWPAIQTTGPKEGATADTHTHLFNAADLPVAGFFKFVLLREQDINSGPLPALIDIFVSVVKPFAATAENERRAWRPGTTPKVYAPEEFAEKVVSRSEALSRGQQGLFSRSAPNAALAESYQELMSLLALERGGTPMVAVDDVASRRRLIRDIAAQAYEPRQVRSRDVSLAADGCESEPDGLPGDLQTLVAWGFLMLQPRTEHLRRFLDIYAKAPNQPRLLVNLMVDYDKWLDDGPIEDGSSHRQQIEFWHLVRQNYESQIELLNFAGYCPLKHAIETRRRQPTHFTYLTQAHKDKTIAGIKLYPPMGFLPTGNAALSNNAFVGTDGIGRRALEAWGSELELGKALDDALDACYTWCACEDVAILAHAGPGNLAATNFEDRPNPSHWVAVAKKFPTLRIALGHLTHNANHFIELMRNPDAPCIPAKDKWALFGGRDFIRHAPGQPVSRYIDIAYTEEILQSETVAREFFLALHRYCAGDANLEGVDPDFSQILYGSDWIMLGNVPAHPLYLDYVATAAKAAGWSDGALDNLFVKNSRRFFRAHPKKCDALSD